MRKVLFEKLTVTQLVKKSPAFYGKLRSITVLTRARHWSTSEPDVPVHFQTYFPEIRSNNIPSSKPMSFEWSLSFRFSDQNFVWVSLLFCACYKPCLWHFLWFYHPNKFYWSVQVMYLFIMLSSPATNYFLPLRSKYFLQHSILIYLKAMFFP
jgi:hypothetical protein